MLKSHKDSFITVDKLGSKYPEYRPTFEFGGMYINTSHQYYSTCPVRDGILIQIKNRPWLGSVIEGWLRREDALKLYEIAYFVTHDILELGSYYGLSTCILSEANKESPFRKRIYSIDLNPACVRQTERNLRSRGLRKDVTTICSDATIAIRTFIDEGKKFEFVFVDHSHAYEPVYEVCRELGKIVVRGGFCLFHDFNDPRNRDSANEDYGVYQAVIAGLPADVFEFYGIFGCSGLFRMK